MRVLSRALVAAAVGVAAIATTIPVAHAITGGQPDGDGHPNVAMLLFYADEVAGEPALRFRCTGSLVSPTIILTAGHCTDGTVGKTLAFFDSTIAEEPPSLLPRAADDVQDPATQEWSGSDTGFLGNEPDGAGRVYAAGTAQTHPDYSDFTDMANWNDVGVVVLDAPVEGVTPMPIAPLNYLDEVAQPRLNSTLFTFVGYGTQVRKPDSGPQKPEPMSYPLIRRVTDAPGQKLMPQILQVNGNPNDVKGDGGTCFGDSGGPGILDGLQVTVTSFGFTDNCRYIDGHQRLDIPVVQAWLAEFGLVDAPAVVPVEESPGKGKGKGNGNGNGKGSAATHGSGNAGANGSAGGNSAISGGNGKAMGHDNATGNDAAHAARGQG